MEGTELQFLVWLQLAVVVLIFMLLVGNSTCLCHFLCYDRGGRNGEDYTTKIDN